MTASICDESHNLLQEMTNLLCDIAFFSGTLAGTDCLTISIEEKKMFQQSQVLSQTGAETLEMCASTPCTAYPLSDAEAKTLETMIHEISLTGYLAADIAQRHSKGSQAIDTFASLYSALELTQRVNKLQTFFTGLDCQRKHEQDKCQAQHYCLVSTWKSQRSERNNMNIEDCHKTKILLVDDDPLVRKAVKRCLTSENYDLKTAESGREALAMLRGDTFDIIIADFLMPGQDGCQLLTHVQQSWPKMARILFTASEDNQRVRDCLKNGIALGLIRKPWDNEHIFSVLDKATDAIKTGSQ